jgi:hypothetical protein
MSLALEGKDELPPYELCRLNGRPLRMTAPLDHCPFISILPFLLQFSLEHILTLMLCCFRGFCDLEFHGSDRFAI